MTSLYRQFLSKAFELIDKAEPDKRLEPLRNALENYPLDEHVVESNIEVNKIHQDIWDLLLFINIYKDSRLDLPIKESSVIAASAILKTLKIWLFDIFKTPEIKSLISFCSIFGYFDLRISQLTNLNDLPLVGRGRVAQLLVDTMNSLKIAAKAETYASNFEIDLVNRYDQTIRDDNFTEAYRLIESLENSTVLHPNYIIREFFKILIEIDFDQYAAFVNARKTPIEYAYTLAPASIDEKLSLGSTYDFDSPWLYYEIIRQSVARGPQQQLSVGNIDCLATIILKIAQKDKEVFMWACKQFFYHMDFSRALGIALALIPDMPFQEFLQSMDLSIYPSDSSIEIASQQFEALKRSGNKSRVSAYSENVYKLWLETMAKASERDNGLIDIYVSDHINAILWYLDMMINNEEELRKSLLEVISNLILIQSTWFKDVSDEKNHFFVNLSKLFVYGKIWKMKNYQLLQLDNLRSLLDKFIKDGRWVISYFYKPGRPEVIKLLTDNFSMTAYSS